MAKLPLEGVRIVAIPVVFAGPFSTMLLADLGETAIIVIRTFGTGKSEKTLFKTLRKNDDFEEVANVLRKFDLKSDDLMAHASLQAAKELLERSAGTVFINK